MYYRYIRTVHTYIHHIRGVSGKVEASLSQSSVSASAAKASKIKTIINQSKEFGEIL
jgi:hypothetical protein